MATITINFKEPEVAVERKCDCICPHLDVEANNSYICNPALAGTAYDTHVPGFGSWEGLVGFIANTTHSPNVLIMFKKAAMTGETVTFEETNPYVAEYIREVGDALADFGFTVEVA